MSIIVGISAAAPAWGQQTGTPAAPTVPAPGCPAVARPAPPTASQRRSARDLIARAQEAAIVADNATARDLYERAERLDPTDASIAYALARSYETAGDVRALSEYCRFVALSPDNANAPDVRQRITSIAASMAAARRAVAATTPIGRPASPPSPGTAFALGAFVPGLGQYYLHQSGAGILYTAAAAGALYYGLHPTHVTVDSLRTAVDPNGNPYTYHDVSVRSTYPNAFTGVALAAVIGLFGATEAYISASRTAEAARQRADAPDSVRASRAQITPVVTSIPGAPALGMRVTIPVGH